jgi:hypothetical protein
VVEPKDSDLSRVSGGDFHVDSMDPGDINNEKDFMTRVHVRNTFLDFSEEDDPWTLTNSSSLRRQQTDSILHRNSSLKEELARATSKVEMLQHPEFPSLPLSLNVDPRFGRSMEDEDEEETRDPSESTEQNENAEQNEKNDYRVSPEIQAMREIAANGGGLSGCTTVMMRQVPFKYTQRKLLREINSCGFMGQYDFIYLPMDPRSHANRGFAFLNMISAEAAEDFYNKFNGQYLRHFSAEKAISVLPADLQGFEENALQYASTAAHRGRRTGHTKPIFFRPLPPRVASKLEESRLAPEPPAPQKKACRLPEPAMCYGGNDAQGMASMLQQALWPDATKASWPLPLFQPQQAAQPRAAVPPTGFCVYCGKRRLNEHLFCPYCGGSFND